MAHRERPPHRVVGPREAIAGHHKVMPGGEREGVAVHRIDRGRLPARRVVAVPDEATLARAQGVEQPAEAEVPGLGDAEIVLHRRRPLARVVGPGALYAARVDDAVHRPGARVAIAVLEPRRIVHHDGGVPVQQIIGVLGLMVERVPHADHPLVGVALVAGLRVQRARHDAVVPPPIVDEAGREVGGVPGPIHGVHHPHRPLGHALDEPLERAAREVGELGPVPAVRDHRVHEPERGVVGELGRVHGRPHLGGGVGHTGAPVRGVLTQPKRLALLAYLAVARPRGFHRRDTLLALLWPEQDRQHARASLRKALHGVRRTLGKEVVAGRGVEDLAVVDDTLRCDAVAFEAAVEAGQFAEAVRLYQGDFLRGFFVTGAPEFERWCEQERSRLRNLAYKAGLILAHIALRDRRPREAVRWARWSYDLEPDDESALGDLMYMLSLVGNRAEALRAYDEFAERLVKERHVRPSAETRRMRELVMISADLVLDSAAE